MTHSAQSTPISWGFWIIPLALGWAGMIASLSVGNTPGAALGGFSIGMSICRLIYSRYIDTPNANNHSQL